MSRSLMSCVRWLPVYALRWQGMLWGMPMAGGLTVPPLSLPATADGGGGRALDHAARGIPATDAEREQPRREVSGGSGYASGGSEVTEGCRCATVQH
eukprot:1157626-Pelagomonas_calceolata.AAC.27